MGGSLNDRTLVVVSLPGKLRENMRDTTALLMFLSQEPPREFPPIYPYPPVGDTDIRDPDFGVQLHAQCPGSHGLRFLSVAWYCVTGRKDIQTAESTSVVPRIYTIDNAQDEDAAVEVDYSWLDRERSFQGSHKQSVLLNTRHRWVHYCGASIYCHEWIDTFDPDDESGHPEGDGGSTTGPNNDAQIGFWMARIMTRHCNSI